MLTTEGLALVSSLISFGSLVLVILQLRDQTSQRRLESLIRIHDINRELVSLGFARPRRFEILSDAENADPIWERRYLQLWFNHLALIHASHQHGRLQPDLETSLAREIRKFVTMRNMRRHWNRHRDYDPAPFRRFVDGAIAASEVEP